MPDEMWRARTEYDYKERRGSASAGRVLKAIQLDSFFYFEVAQNLARTREAVLVGFASALVMGLGLMLMRIVPPISWLLGGLAWGALVLFGGTWFFVAVGRRTFAISSDNCAVHLAAGVAVGAFHASLAEVDIGKDIFVLTKIFISDTTAVTGGAVAGHGRRLLE